MPPLVRRATLALFAATSLGGQSPARDSIPRPAERAPISDNSFLVEEAYNQEAGVVQHASTFSKITGSTDWGYSLTQEWPLGGRRHQLSYTIPVSKQGDPASAGVGDVMVNYRLQALFDEARGLAISPRLSLSVPTGDHKKGLGLGGTGLQVNLPVSKTMGKSFVSHTNAGAGWFARAPGAGDATSSLRNVSLGQSFIWLAASRLNFLVETVWTRATRQSDAASVTEDAGFIIPGVRWGHDMKSGLQIVPGIGVPIGIGPSAGTRQIFLYLSLEHSFSAAGR